MRKTISFLIAVMMTAGAVGAVMDWPQYRGPLGNGVSGATNVPLTWGTATNLAWKTLLPGRGRSSPVLLGDKVWVTTAIEQGIQRTRINGDDMQTAEGVELGVVCLRRTDGQILWHVTLFKVDQPDPVHWLNSWATPTPVIEQDRLYCDFGTFGTACLEAATGKTLWQTRLPLDHQVGPGSSPILYQDLLVLVRDGRDAQYVTALSKRTGQPVWRTERPPIQASSGNIKKSFCSPLVFNTAGKTQMVVPGAHWVVSYDPASGQENWRLRHGEGFSIGASPVFGHGMVYFSTGCMKPQLLAVRADGQDNVTATHLAWKSPRQIPVMSSPVLVGEELYWVSDDGMVSCAEARTGQIHWQERLGGSHLASPISAQGRLYLFGQDGRTTVVKTGTQFERLAENPLEGPVIATPAVVDGSVFLRTDTHLYRIGQL